MIEGTGPTAINLQISVADSSVGELIGVNPDSQFTEREADLELAGKMGT